MILNYFKFLTKATNQHGVHSPFVYQLVTQCIYKKSAPTIKKTFKLVQQNLIQNTTTINVTDLGSGSRVFKSSVRRVGHIAKNAGIRKKYALLLNRLVSYLNIHQTLEIGTSLGLGTSALAIHNKFVKIETLEGCPETLKIAKTLFKDFEIQSQIKTHQGDFKDVLSKVVTEKVYDLIYFDGNHQKVPTLTYFEQCLKSKHNDTVFIFDDIYWSDEMKEAWAIIKEHPEVTVTIDLFQWGIVFFRKEQKKEHFKIRF